MDEQHAQAFGRYLKEHREAMTLTTRALARLAEVDQATVVRLEAGAIREPRPDKLRRLSEALGLNPSETFAQAGYMRAYDLPDLPVYLASKYRELTVAEIDQIEAYVASLLERHGPDVPSIEGVATLAAEEGQL